MNELKLSPAAVDKTPWTNYGFEFGYAVRSSGIGSPDCGIRNTCDALHRLRNSGLGSSPNELSVSKRKAIWSVIDA